MAPRPNLKQDFLLRLQSPEGQKVLEQAFSSTPPNFRRLFNGFFVYGKNKELNKGQPDPDCEKLASEIVDNYAAGNLQNFLLDKIKTDFMPEFYSDGQLDKDVAAAVFKGREDLQAQFGQDLQSNFTAACLMKVTEDATAEIKHLLPTDDDNPVNYNYDILVAEANELNSICTPALVMGGLDENARVTILANTLARVEMAQAYVQKHPDPATPNKLTELQCLREALAGHVNAGQISQQDFDNLNKSVQGFNKFYADKYLDLADYLKSKQRDMQNTVMAQVDVVQLQAALPVLTAKDPALLAQAMAAIDAFKFELMLNLKVKLFLTTKDIAEAKQDLYNSINTSLGQSAPSLAQHMQDYLTVLDIQKQVLRTQECLTTYLAMAAKINDSKLDNVAIDQDSIKLAQNKIAALVEVANTMQTKIQDFLDGKMKLSELVSDVCGSNSQKTKAEMGQFLASAQRAMDKVVLKATVINKVQQLDNIIAKLENIHRSILDSKDGFYDHFGRANTTIKQTKLDAIESVRDQFITVREDAANYFAGVKAREANINKISDPIQRSAELKKFNTVKDEMSQKFLGRFDNSVKSAIGTLNQYSKTFAETRGFFQTIINGLRKLIGLEPQKPQTAAKIAEIKQDLGAMAQAQKSTPPKLG